MVGKVRQRILVIEDEALIALDIRSILERVGFEVLGPLSSVKQALARLDQVHPDGAVLDMKLGEELSFSVADALSYHKVPFVFVTGHPIDVVPSRHRQRPTVEKPYQDSDLLRAVAGVCGNRAARAQ